MRINKFSLNYSFYIPVHQMDQLKIVQYAKTSFFDVQQRIQSRVGSQVSCLTEWEIH